MAAAAVNHMRQHRAAVKHDVAIWTPGKVARLDEHLDDHEAKLGAWLSAWAQTGSAAATPTSATAVVAPLAWGAFAPTAAAAKQRTAVLLCGAQWGHAIQYALISTAQSEMLSTIAGGDFTLQARLTGALFTFNFAGGFLVTSRAICDTFLHHRVPLSATLGCQFLRDRLLCDYSSAPLSLASRTPTVGSRSSSCRLLPICCSVSFWCHG
jgi:hypothetical protein